MNPSGKSMRWVVTVQIRVAGRTKESALNKVRRRMQHSVVRDYEVVKVVDDRTGNEVPLREEEKR